MANALDMAAQGEGIIQQEIAFVLLLTVAALVAILTRRIRLPYTVALVVVGLILALFPNFISLNISSELILAVLVPPLVFEATLAIKWRDLNDDGVVGSELHVSLAASSGAWRRGPPARDESVFPG